MLRRSVAQLAAGAPQLGAAFGQAAPCAWAACQVLQRGLDVGLVAPGSLSGLFTSSGSGGFNSARAYRAAVPPPGSEVRSGAASSAGPSAAAQLQQWRGLARRPAGARPRPRASPPQPALEAQQVVAPDAPVVQPTEAPPSELAVRGVVGHQALIVTRPIEWGTVLLGFEQANRYQVFDEQGNVVALLAEDEGSLGRVVGRQLLRTRRPFTATVFSPDGTQVIFRLRRPFYMINSTIYIEQVGPDGEYEVVGEVHQRWHLWRRKYDLYMDKRQFAEISGGLLAWDFELKDESGRTLALIDRNFSGFGKELFTDAGKYVLHFGSPAEDAAQQLANTIHAQHPDRPPPPVTALARVATGVEVIPTCSGNQLVVHRPLALSERMIALAAAISIDYDYFSRHSYGGGLLSPFVHPPIIPFPVPMGGGAAGAEEAAAGAGDAAGAAGAAAGAEEAAAGAGAGAEAPQPPPAEGAGEPLERDLGGDDWPWSRQQEAEEEEGGWGSGDDGGDGGDGGGGLFDAFRDFFGDE